MKTSRRLFAAFTLAAAATFAVAPLGAATNKGDWNATQVKTADGYRVGNPDAPVQLIEFVSPTCIHCINFHRESAGALQALYIPSGKVAVELRPVVRNEVDQAIFLLATCGKDENFFGNYQAIIARVNDWAGLWDAASKAQTDRWKSRPFATAMRAVATDLQFYTIMEPRGYSRAQLDKCLADEAKIDGIMAQRSADVDQWPIRGTPSFVINGVFQQDVHGWGLLQKRLDAAIAAKG